jgi:hypothetical protein
MEKTKIIAFCKECGETIGIFPDNDSMIIKIAEQKKCNNCGSKFSFLGDGRIWNVDTKMVGSKSKNIDPVHDFDQELQYLVLKSLYELEKINHGKKVDFHQLLEHLVGTYSNLAHLSEDRLLRILNFLHEKMWVIYSQYIGRPKQIYITRSGIEFYLTPKFNYYSCFISYGEPDKIFTEKLVKALEEKQIACWYYSADNTPGERTWREIGRKRREAEKMVVLCSIASLIRDGLLKEIEDQIDEDPDKIIPISLEPLWKEQRFLVRRGTNDLKPFLIERNYADFSNLDKFEDSIERLFHGLEKSLIDN